MTDIPTYHRGDRNFGTGYDMMKQIEALEDEIERLRAALKECEAEIDHYIWMEYPHDHPVHERYRKRDFAANPARAALTQEGK